MAMSEAQRSIARYIAAQVKHLRAESRLSQEGLAREAQRSRQTIFDIERAERIADWNTLEAVAEALGVELQALIPPPGRSEGEAGIRYLPQTAVDLLLSGRLTGALHRNGAQAALAGAV